MTLFANFSSLTGDEQRPWALLSCKTEISKLISSGDTNSVGIVTFRDIMPLTKINRKNKERWRQKADPGRQKTLANLKRPKRQHVKVAQMFPFNPLFYLFIYLFIFISFAIPKYNNYNYNHKAYMNKRTTHLSTRAILQSHTRYAHCYFTSAIQKRRN